MFWSCFGRRNFMKFFPPYALSVGKPSTWLRYAVRCIRGICTENTVNTFVDQTAQLNQRLSITPPPRQLGRNREEVHDVIVDTENGIIYWYLIVSGVVFDFERNRVYLMVLKNKVYRTIYREGCSWGAVTRVFEAHQKLKIYFVNKQHEMCKSFLKIELVETTLCKIWFFPTTFCYVTIQSIYTAYNRYPSFFLKFISLWRSVQSSNDIFSL